MPASKRAEKVAKRRLAFVREAKNYVRFIRRQIRTGMYMTSPEDTPLFKAFDALRAAENGPAASGGDRG